MGFSDFKHSDQGDNYLERKDLLDGIRLAKRYLRKGLSIVNKPFIDEVINLCIEERRYTQALRLVYALQQSFPTDPELAYAAALCELRRNKPHKAQILIESSLNEDYTNLEYTLLAGEIYLSLQLTSSASECFARAANMAPLDAKLHFEIGQLYHNYNYHEQSLHYSKKAINYAPDNSEYIFQVALLLDALEQPKESLAKYDEYLYLRSNCAVGWYNRSLVLLKLNKINEALESCLFAISIDDTLTEALFTAANIYADLGNFANAIAHFEKLIYLEPGNAYAFYNLGALYADEMQYEKAVYFFTRFLEIHPEGFEGYAERGYCLLKMNSLEDALSDLRNAILYETPKLARLRLDMQQVRKMHKKLITRVKKLRFLTKHEPKVYLAKLVDHLLILRKHDAAIEVAKKYANNGVDKSFSLALLAKIYFILGNTILGYAMLSQAVPANSDLFNNVRCLMPKTGATRLFTTLFCVTKNLNN